MACSITCVGIVKENVILRFYGARNCKCDLSLVAKFQVLMYGKYFHPSININILVSVLITFILQKNVYT